MTKQMRQDTAFKTMEEAVRFKAKLEAAPFNNTNVTITDLGNEPTPYDIFDEMAGKKVYRYEVTWQTITAQPLGHENTVAEGEEEMTTINSKCGNYAVEFVRTNNEGSIMACAVIRDGLSYGGNSWWFTIGHYKNEKNALRQAIKKMKQMGKELEDLEL